MVNVIELKPGTKIRLVDDATAEVVTNPRDGIWIQVRYLTSPADPAQVGSEELLFAENIVEVLGERAED
jgi:hypothetical protein